ncbi:InlB B-repeat-containing protein, partial [uncultured Oscillibacter sp.]|uniref:InlB B-repeat-containing protein n=1 Tax=uncultured Oscillibacter sp. TaxID=876091 RepID=UPI0025D13522
MKKRILSSLLCAVMLVTLLPTAALAAETEPVEKPIVMLGAGSPLGYDAATKTYDKLYFGTYPADEGGEGSPYVWRILDGETSNGEDGLFLLSMKVYDDVRFTLPCNETNDWWLSAHNIWTSPGCSAREWCRSLAESREVFSDAERSAMLATNQPEGDRYYSEESWFVQSYGGVKLGTLDRDKVFYLSARDLEDARYGLRSDTDYDSVRYALRSAVDADFTVDDETIHDGTIAVALKGQTWSGLNTIRIYYKEFSGFQFSRELTAAEKFFIGSAGDFGFFGNFLPTGAEETYSYQYNSVTARPAMNLKGDQVLYIIPADNRSHALTYGDEISAVDSLEWKAVLLNGDESFAESVSLPDAPANFVFDSNGGTMKVNYSLDKTKYTTVTASLEDKDGGLIYYGKIDNHTVSIPANLSDGVYTLRITAEQRGGEKVSDLAAQPYMAELKVANPHNHPVCGIADCQDHGANVTWTPITTAEELAAMTADSYCFLIGDVTAPETPCVGHLCTNGFAVTGTLIAGNGLTLCGCRGMTEVPAVSVADNGLYTQYGLTVKDLSAGTGSTLNLYGNKGKTNAGYATGSAHISQLGTGTKLNIYGGAWASSMDEDDRMNGVALPEGSVVNVYSGELTYAITSGAAEITVHDAGVLRGITLTKPGSKLTVKDGGRVDWRLYAENGTTVDLYRCTAGNINSSGDVNLYGAVSGATFQIDKALNIKQALGDAPAKPSVVNIKNEAGTLKWTDGVFTSGWAANMSGADGGSYLTSASGYETDKTESGELYCKKVGHKAGSHPVCGAECAHDTKHDGVEWQEISKWSEIQNKDDSAVLTDGHYCLTQDISAGQHAKLYIRGNVDLCLNGYTLQFNTIYNSCIHVESGTLNICDCVGTGKITGGRGKTVYDDATQEVNYYGGAIWMAENTKVNLYGGDITGNEAHFGNAVYVPKNAVFTMYGGALSDNTTNAASADKDSSVGTQYSGKLYAKGGAVYVDGGSFVMNGGVISGNSTYTANEDKTTALNDGGGAVYVNGGGSFTMNGGTMTGNSAGPYGGGSNTSWDFGGCGVRVFNGTFTMNGGEFDKQDDAVQVDANGVFQFNGGSMTNGGECAYCRRYGADTTTSEAGHSSCIWLNGGKADMANGTSISANSSDIYTAVLNGGTFTMSGGSTTQPVTVPGGTFTMTGGTFTLVGTMKVNGGAFHMSGGAIRSAAKEKNTGVTLTSGTFDLSGGEIADFARGVEVRGGTLTVSGTAKVTENGTTLYGIRNLKNVYLSSGMKMNVGEMTAGAEIGVTMSGAPGVFTSGGSSYADFFSPDDPNYTVSASGSDLQLSGGPTEVTSVRIFADGEELTTTLAYYELTIKVGQTVQLTAKFDPEDVKYRWYTDPVNIECLTLTEDGKLTGIKSKDGTPWVRLLYNNDKKEKILHVRIEEPESYTVTYDMQGHGTQIEASQAAPNQTVTAPAKPAEPGYVFGGWYKDAECTKAWDFAADTVTGSTTLYAKWTPSQYSFTLDPDGGVCSEQGIMVTFGAAFGALPVPARAGYEFEGWYDAAGNRIEETTVLSAVPGNTAAARTLTARWKANTCTVTLDPNGGACTQESVSAVRGGTYGDLPDPTRAGYDFDGWYTEKDGGTKIGSTTTVPDGDHIIYAHWSHTHDWGEWTSNGDGTHTRVCAKDESHTETENCSGGTATCQTKAVCSDCNQPYGDYAAHVPAEAWSKDESGHWHACQTAGCTEKLNFAGHTPGPEATEENPQTCTECGYEIAPAAGHTHEWGEWTSNGDGTHTRTCTKDSSHTETENCSGGTATCQTKAVCSDCGAAYGELAAHVPAEAWSKDESGHWHACQTTGCTEKLDFAGHTPGPEATEKDPQTCTACGYEIAPAAGHTHEWGEWTSNGDGTHTRTCAKDSSHTETENCSGGTATCQTKAVCSDCNQPYGDFAAHVPAETWSKDASGHWHACQTTGCTEKLDFAGHTPGPEATEKDPQTCTACGYEIAPAAGHTHEWGEWTSNGDGTHTRTCAKDSSHTETENCSGGTATCQTKAVCSACGAAYGELNTGNHTGGTEVRGRVEA